MDKTRSPAGDSLKSFLGRIVGLLKRAWPARVVRKLGRLSRRQRLLLTGSIASFLIFLPLFLHFMPARLQFAFGQPTCTFNPVLLPHLTKVQPSPNFSADIRPALSIGQRPLVSFTTCVTVHRLPSPEQQEIIELKPFNNSLLKKRVVVAVGTLPQPTPEFEPDTQVGSTALLRFHLDRNDAELHARRHRQAQPLQNRRHRPFL